MNFHTASIHCTVCDKSIEGNGTVLGFPALVLLAEGFKAFYGGYAHQECMDTWARKDEFVAYFNGLVSGSDLDSPWRLVVLPSGAVGYARDLQHDCVSQSQT
jgi:hypothetical protein